VLIETAFGKHYAVEYTSDADGSVVIDLGDYPQGLFNTQDNFTLTVVTELNGTAETLTICEVDYTCIQLSFANTTVTDVDFCEQIGCDTESIVINTSAFECDGVDGVVTVGFTIVAGSGSYALEIEVLPDDWAILSLFNSVDGNGSASGIYNITPDPLNFSIRVRDTVTNYTSNEVVVTITPCP
jgi:hypothetical protein